MECIRWKDFKDGKNVSIYDFFIYDLIIITIGMRIANLLVKTSFLVAPCKDTPLPIVFDKKFVTLIRHGEILLFFTGI
jgi:hypothetical protein